MKIEELHDKLFDTLCLVDDICKKEHVRWFLDSGTEIGSVREKDIIPWDDDVDIKVLREDYPAFKRAMEKNLPEYMHFIEPTVFAPAFYDFIPRIYDERIPLRTETDEDRFYNNYQNRLGIDVFIFDKAPDSAFARKMLMLKNKMLYGMGMSKRYKSKSEKYTFIQKLQVKVCGFLGKFYTSEQIYGKWLKLVTKWQGKATGWRYNSNYPMQELNFYREELFKEDAVGVLRGRNFPIPVGYDEELTQLYGDYKNPPKDKDAYIKHVELE
jgi:lipopolysaccharide cholinephosphotransferase